MKPTDSRLAKDGVPVDITRLQLAGSSVAPVGVANCPADAIAPLGEIETVADRSAHAVIGSPDQIVRADAPLHDAVFDQVADFVVDEGRDHRCLKTKALSQAAGDVVFPAALPGLKMPGAANASLTGIKPQHHLSERYGVKQAGIGRLDRQAHAASFQVSIKSIGRERET